MVELEDTLDLDSSAKRLVGSNPTWSTIVYY